MKLLFYTLTFAAAVALGYGGWCLERWANWKLSYGPRVEERLINLEKRLGALEAKQ